MAGYGTTRISAAAQGVLREMAKAEGRPMLALLDEAIETLRRKRFLEQVNAEYAALRSDPAAWKAMEAERADWDATLADGLSVAEGRPSYRAREGGRRKRARR